jgi:hypothetical protein
VWQRTVKHRDGSVEDTKSSFDLDGKVNVARGVNKVDPMLLPTKRCHGRLDGDASVPARGRAAIA